MKLKNLWDGLSEQAALTGEAFPGFPLVELAGDSRVLIEHHSGVREFSRERIGVQVRYGCVLVYGTCLELTHMTKEQLVITGKIDCVKLVRRGK